MPALQRSSSKKRQRSKMEDLRQTVEMDLSDPSQHAGNDGNDGYEHQAPEVPPKRTIPGSYPADRPRSPNWFEVPSRRNSAIDKEASHHRLTTESGYADGTIQTLAQPETHPVHRHFNEQSEGVLEHTAPPTSNDTGQEWQLVTYSKAKPTRDARYLKTRRSVDEIKVHRKSERVGRETEYIHQRNLFREEIESLRKELSQAERAAHQYRSYMQREIGSLRKQLSESSSHLNQAERVAQQNRIEMQRLTENCRTNHIVKTSGDGDLKAVLNALQEENQSLKKNLDDARSHIFSLQPYITDMTPERIGTLFDDLMSNVMEWVTEFVDQFQDNRSRIDELLSLAKRKPGEFAKLRKQIERHDDLSSGCLSPDTDIDIFVAITTRWLDENMFQTVLCGITPQCVEVITYIEASMQKLEPKRDLYAIRSWRAETLNALIASSEYQRTRRVHAERLTIALADIFKPFRKQQDKQEYYRSCLREIIMPALELDEAMSTSIHHYYLDLDPYANFNTKQELNIGAPDLIEKLSQLKLENILQNRKTLVLAKLQPCPSREEFQQMLVNVATIAPALRMKQVGMGDAIRPTTIVRPQHMLVAFGSQEQRENYLNNGEPTLITQVFHVLNNPSRGGSLWSSVVGCTTPLALG